MPDTIIGVYTKVSFSKCNGVSMSHVFISYSSKNSEYTYRLADKLRDEGFDVWVDNARLRSSQDWWKSIVLAIWDCDAFVVVLTPESDDSIWVQTEITIAINHKKHVFPLWLAGTRNTPNWEIFARIQTEDVRDGEMPSSEFFDYLAEQVPRKETRGEDLTGEANLTLSALGTLTVDTETLAEIENPPPLEPNDVVDEDAQEIDEPEALFDTVLDSEFAPRQKHPQLISEAPAQVRRTIILIYRR